MTETDHTADEMMTVAASRALQNGQVCFVGIGQPSAAANLARQTHAPDVVLIYESGTLETRPDVLSIGDGELAETALTNVSVPEMFRYWLQGGRIDVGFLGAAQVDRFGNINTTVIGGTYLKPKTRLPGAGGAPEIATSAKETFILLRQSTRAFVAELDFVTSLGHGTGGNSRAEAGAVTKGPTRLISDLCQMAPDPETKEFVVTTIHPGVTRDRIIAATGWDIRFADTVTETVRPEADELAVLREIHARTARAHGGQA